MRAAQVMRTRLRAWDQMGDSILGWLTDQAWIVRMQELPGTDDGTPNEHEAVLGPYDAKMSAAVPAVFRQPDRFTLEGKHTLAIASDIEPLESDEIRVIRDGKQFKCHPVSVLERRTVWGEVFLWSLEVSEFSEF